MISPDGRMLMFNSPTSMPGDQPIIWIRPLDAVEARPLPGTLPGNAFWSADSREIAFTSPGRLNRIDAAGGPVQLICDLPGVFMGGAWNRAGEIVFTVIDGRMFRVPATGGVPAEIARSEQARTAGYTFNWPSFLPDGRHILVTAWHADPAKRQIQVRTLDDATAVTILNVGSNAFYAPPGYLLYQRDGTLMAQAFDANRLVTSGEAVRISDVPINRTTGRGAFSVSDNGVLAYRAGASSDPISTLTWYDRQGRVLGTVGDPGPHNQIRLSPDGTRVILALVDLKLSTYVLSVLDLGSGVASRMTPRRRECERRRVVTRQRNCRLREPAEGTSRFLLAARRQSQRHIDVRIRRRSQVARRLVCRRAVSLVSCAGPGEVVRAPDVW